MQILRGKHISVGEDCAVMLGKFDGMHRGHQTLLEEVLRRKAEGLAALVFTFSVSPKSLIDGDESRRLMTQEEKERYFERAGIDYLVEFTFDEASRQMSAEDFARDVLVRDLRARAVIVGEDFGFGYRRAGNTSLLSEMSEVCGYELCVKRKLKDEDGLVISSTRILEAVERGDMETAERLLGRPFSYIGVVEHGKGMGTAFGYPTVNIPIPAGKAIPPRGVYASCVRVGGSIWLGATDLGVKPTIEGEREDATETFILDFDGDLYGSEVEILMRKYLREERRFESLDALTEQIGKDVQSVREMGTFYA